METPREQTIHPLLDEWNPHETFDVPLESNHTLVQAYGPSPPGSGGIRCSNTCFASSLELYSAGIFGHRTAMYRSLFFLIFGPLLVQAAPVSLFVNCNGFQKGITADITSSFSLACDIMPFEANAGAVDPLSLIFSASAN
jgi:hypothetical protein